MSYFDKIPYSEFQIDKRERVLVRDIIRAVRLDPGFLEDATLFIPYEAKNDETPEVISYKFYGTVAYHWVVALLNSKYDYLNDYPRSEAVVREYTQNKYGTLNKIHHFEDLNGNWVDDVPLAGGSAFKIPITVLDFEKRENEKKRTMKILRKELLNEFINSYESAITQ